MISSGLRRASASGALGFFTDRSKVLLVQIGAVDDPAVRPIGAAALQLDELRQITVVQRVGLAQAAARIELVIPDVPRRLRLSRRTAPRF